MPPKSHHLRHATAADFEAICEIYGHHVLHGLASFEETPPDVDEMRRRWGVITDAGLSYIVALDDASSKVLGYAYAGPYRARPAYRHSVENSVYVAPDLHRRGVGGALMQRIISDCEALGWVRQMIAIIGNSANAASVGLHERHGFRHVGTLQSVGFKHGGWVDTVMMQRAIGVGDELPPAA